MDIHSRAMEIASRYRRAEAELIDILQQVEAKRVFIDQGCSSLFDYVVHSLGIGENVACTLITVARKAREVPELKAHLEAGTITLSNARRVTSVITPQNQGEWLEKASALSSRQLEKEIVRVKPEAATQERASYVTPERVRLELGLSEEEMLRLRKIQDLLSQRKQRPVTLEETLSEMMSDYQRRHDPIEKAKRHAVREGRSEPVGELVTRREGRTPIPAAIVHQVNLRDQRRCTHHGPDGKRCRQTRWLDVHHIIHVEHGGTNSLDNLVTLCASHHRLIHRGLATG